uniref:BH3-interacting domain death agonist n=1 Tax=Junco hyemalis TaxID=40217 RepID=A0A8C5JE04_JUNHY
MEQINGPLQMEHALLFSFLDVSSDCKFKEQLHSLQSQQIMLCQGSDDDEVQTDGNRSGHFRNGDVGLAPTNEEVLRVIAAQLAEIGDQFDREIQERVVNGLVQHFLNENLSNEEITRHMSRVVGELMQAIPSDMEREKAMLVLAMVLTKKIVNTVPSLLRRVFDTTVNYMNRQFHNYIVDMVSAVRQLCGSHSQPFGCPGLFPEGWPSSGLPAAFPVVLRRLGQKAESVPAEIWK